MTEKTEKEKMLVGEYFDVMDPQLDAERTHARWLTHRLNVTEYGNPEATANILKELLPESGENLLIVPPFYCDYGYNIKLGHNVFFNLNCVVLDVAPVTIGSNALFGPNVQIYTAAHPTNAEERRTMQQFGKSITIGDDCWIGGGAIICPGVTIGDRCIIGAGAVVTKDVPDDSIAFGNPARVR